MLIFWGSKIFLLYFCSKKEVHVEILGMKCSSQ